MNNAQKIEFIKVAPSMAPGEMTPEQKAFYNRTWDEFNDEEKALFYAAWEQTAGTIENAVLNSGTRAERATAAKVLREIVNRTTEPADDIPITEVLDLLERENA